MIWILFQGWGWGWISARLTSWPHLPASTSSHLPDGWLSLEGLLEQRQRHDNWTQNPGLNITVSCSNRLCALRDLWLSGPTYAEWPSPPNSGLSNKPVSMPRSPNSSLSFFISKKKKKVIFWSLLKNTFYRKCQIHNPRRTIQHEPITWLQIPLAYGQPGFISTLMFSPLHQYLEPRHHSICNVFKREGYKKA